MRVRDIKALIEREKLNDEDSIQFHDRTTKRQCPINSHYVRAADPPLAGAPPEQKTLWLSNTLPRTF
jgi:hypothetical protein